MKTRALLPSSVAVLLAVSGSASEAATKPKPKPPLCNLIVSPKGNTPYVLTKEGNGGLRVLLDTTHQPSPYATPPGYDPALDVVSGDIASNGSKIVVVFRLASLAVASPPPGIGRHYIFGWTWASSGVGANIYADVTASGQTVGSSKGGTLVIDKARSEIRVTQPIDQLTGHPNFPPGERMTNLRITTDLSVNALPLSGALGAAGEVARSTKDYPHLAPSCVKIGR